MPEELILSARNKIAKTIESLTSPVFSVSELSGVYLRLYGLSMDVRLARKFLSDLVAAGSMMHDPISDSYRKV